MSPTGRRPPEERLEVRRSFVAHDPLGEGAMGEVFAAREAGGAGGYAVKLLRPDLAGDAGARERFAAEAELTAAVAHRGAIPVHGGGETADGRPFYVMRRVEGRTLREILDEPRALTDLHARQRLLDRLGEVAATVAAAHRVGIVHRDLKPDNVIVSDDGSVTVIDWGLAKRYERSPSTAGTPSRTVRGDVLGTPGYLAPEQASGAAAEAGPAADVFSLGAILYEILTGANPFPGATPRESILAAIHRDPPELGRKAWLRLSPSLAAVCRKALEKEPAKRYRDAGAFAADLRALREGRPALAAAPALVERVRWAAKRKPVRFAALAVAAAIAGQALAFWLVQTAADRRAAARAKERVALRDAQVEAIASRLRDAELADDARERSSLEIRRLLQQVDAIDVLREASHLRFAPDAAVGEEAKRRLFEALRTALDLGDPELARALADAVVEREGEAESLARSFTDAERGRLEALRDEASRAMARTAQEPPPGEAN